MCSIVNNTTTHSQILFKFDRLVYNASSQNDWCNIASGAQPAVEQCIAIATFFTAQHGMQMRSIAMRILSVRLSVRPHVRLSNA